MDVVGGSAVTLLFEGLVVFDAQGRLAPGIASRWETEENGRVWRFFLDANAKDSEGRVVGANDVVESFRRLLDPKTASPRSWVLEAIRGAADFHAGRSDSLPGLIARDGVVEMALESPTPSFGALLAMPNAAVLPAGGDVSGLVSTGPWTLVEHVRDSHLLLRRNPHWHGGAAAFEELQVRILPEEITRVAEFEVGGLDVLEVPTSESARFRSDERYAGGVHRQVLLAVEYIGFNNEDPVLRDPRVRRALNHAVNVELILAQVLGGRGIRAAGAVPPVLGGGGGEPFTYDPDAAKRLLAESRVPADWELELWQRPSPVASQVLEAVQADLAKVGVRAVLRVRDWSALKASIDQGQTPAFFANWFGDYPDAENFLVPLFHSSHIGGGGNRARFRDAAVDSALDALATLPAGPERTATCAALDQRIHAAAPWIYLWHPASEIVVSSRLQGFQPSRVPVAERWTSVHLAPVTP